MEYRKKYFNPENPLQDFRDKKNGAPESLIDRRDGMLYLYNEDIILAINVAIATGRPLLVTGPPGCGKSSLAYNIARVLERKYYEVVITSRTKSQDLLWSFDAVRRLGDSQAGLLKIDEKEKIWKSYYPYVEPGVLWWLFDSNSATRKGLESKNERGIEQSLWYPSATDPAVFTPGTNKKSVLLIDEIDKADPDFPNNLLVPLGSLEFFVEEIHYKVSFKHEKPNFKPDDLPLVIITSNEERELPAAFIRRCITLRLQHPKRDFLIELAIENFGKSKKNISVYSKVLEIYTKMLGLVSEGEWTEVSTAEYLDAAQAALQLELSDNVEILEKLLEATIFKGSKM